MGYVLFIDQAILGRDDLERERVFDLSDYLHAQRRNFGCVNVSAELSASISLNSRLHCHSYKKSEADMKCIYRSTILASAEELSPRYLRDI